MMARLTLLFSDANGSYDLDPRQTTVAGVSATCDLDLKVYFQGDHLRTISRRHFRITFIADEGYAICDLNSLNGTRVNGWRLRPDEPQFLKNGDTIMLAENRAFVIHVTSDDFGHTRLLTPLVVEQTPSAPAPAGLLHLAADGQFILDGVHIAHAYLTVLEERLLLYLYERSGRVCIYDDLIHGVWGYPKYEEVQDNTVAKLVSNLRKKLDGISPGAGPRHIQTVHGRGVKCTPV